jgi:putative ABC transport system permease protein
VTAIPAEARARGRAIALPLSLRLALRELRGGFSGFYIFIACIALGAAALASIGTLASAIQTAIAREGRVLLGGDVEASLVHRRATDAERAFLTARGQVSEVATLRSMARLTDGSSQALVLIKAVDGAYPLYGAAALEEDANLSEALRRPGTAAVERALLEQLGLKKGDRFNLGEASLEITALVASEPDRLSAGPTLGPRVMMSLETLQQTGLAQPGSLIDWRYRIKEPEAGALAGFKDDITQALPDAGFQLRDKTDPAPQIRNAIDRLADFLTLVGLTALLSGGIGVANAVSAFIERKRKVIAIYKATGASRDLIIRGFLIQVLLLALIGILIGLAIGSALPFVFTALYGSLLPVRLEVGIYPGGLLSAAGYGLLTALIFILWPLGRASRIRAGELLREEVEGKTGWPPASFIVASIACAALLVVTAIFFAQDRKIAAITLAAVAVTFVLFAALGQGFRWLARRLPRPRRPEFALALANIAGPGGLTQTVTISLGAGLTLLTAIALTNASLTAEFKTQIPERAPSHFFVGIPKASYDGFAALIARTAPGSELEVAPMLRGKIVSLAGTPAARIKAPPQAEWVMNGDRGLTFSDAPPKDAKIVEGQWWAKDHTGEQLVSFEAELGEALGLKIGDEVTVNVLGRNVSAKIANFRTVSWNSFGINFVMIFSPNTLRAAPYNMLATLNWNAPHDAKAEADVVRAVTASYPSITSVRVRDALETFNSLMGKVFAAIRVAGGLTLFSGVLVLAGALATARARRIYEAVILKTLGATRWRIVGAHLAEHLILGLATALVASAAGAVVAYIILTQLMEINFHASPFALLQASFFTTIFMIAFGLFGTLRVLGAKSSTYLRTE